MKNIKRIFAILLALASMLTIASALTSCSFVVDVECVEHTWGEWGIVISEDCENDGYRARVCTVCKKSEGEKIPAAHRFVDGACARCGVIECKNHTYGDWQVVVSVKCTQNGHNIRTCTTCGATDSEIIYAKGHSYVDGACSVCGKVKPSGGNDGSGGELDPICQHVDTDDNKLCDLCNGDIIVVIDIYAINDLHGKIFDTDTQPGVDELTTYFKNAHLTDDNVIILSSGDMWQGTSESNLTHGNMMTEWLNSIGTVSMTFGNHEFDWNNSYIYDNLEISTFPFLAINIYDTNTNTRVDFATPSVVVDRGGARIGIIGAIGDCYSSISQDKVMGMEFKLGSALTSLVKAEADRLRALGCDMIVYSVHDGLAESGYVGEMSDGAFGAYYDTMLSNGYVDVVFEAHSHHSYVCTDRYGVYHLQGGGENSGISHVELSLNVITDKVNVGTAETVRSYVYDDHAPDDIVDELREKYKDEIAKGEELLGYANSYVDGDVLRQVCADQYLKYGLELWGDKYNIVLGGGYIGIRSPYDLYAGDVYYKDIYSLFPFDNALCLCTVPGYKLRGQFVESTNSNYFISYSEYGNGVKNSINNNQTYYIITDTYSAFYSYNGCTIVDMLDEEIFARDMIAEYIKEGGLGKKPDTPATPGGSVKPDVSELDIKTVAEIKSVIDDIGNFNVESTAEYYMLVTIIDEPNQTYGNCMVKDDTGEIYIYGLKDELGAMLYSQLPEKPSAGDTILVCGRVMMYYNQSKGELKYEMKNARLIAINP